MINKDYYTKEIDVVRESDEMPRMQLSADGNKTRWMSVTKEQLEKIERVLKEEL